MQSANIRYPDHNNEVKTVTITRGTPILHTNRHDHTHTHPNDISIDTWEGIASRDSLLHALDLLPEGSIWWVQFVKFANDNDALIFLAGVTSPLAKMQMRSLAGRDSYNQ
jgi:hypothetical protein